MNFRNAFAGISGGYIIILWYMTTNWEGLQASYGCNTQQVLDPSILVMLCHMTHFWEWCKVLLVFEQGPCSRPEM